MICSKCGQVLPEGATTCSFCGEAVTPQTQPVNQPSDTIENAPLVEEKHENVVKGTIGALIGSLIGGACIILLGQLGYVAAISGIVLAFCALKGYELLGGKLSTKGIVISIIFMLVVPAVAFFINVALSVVGEFPDATFGEALSFVIELTQYDSEMQSAVVTELLMLYGFTALGAFSLVASAFKKKK